MVRSGRARRARARVWSEIGVSVGVLLVPPLLIGGAVYGLLPAHDDVTARDSAPAAVDSLPADFNSRSTFDAGADEPLTVAALVSPAVAPLVSPAAALVLPAPNAAAKPAMSSATKLATTAAAPAKPTVSAATKPVATKADAPPAKAAPGPPNVATAEPTTFALASDHSVVVGKDAARVGALGPVPVQVTVVVAPSAAEAEAPVSLAAPPPSIAAPPPAPEDAPPAATAARSTEPPREHHGGTQHSPRPHFRHLARRNQMQPDAPSQERTTQQRAAEPPQHDFSLRNLFQQQGGQGVRQKNAVRG